MASGSKRTKSLRALFGQIPDNDEILNILFDLTTQTDRTAAIVGGAILEDRLRRSIALYLRTDLTDDDQSSLFEDRGPLTDFDAKIRIAYCLGMLSRENKQDFDHIRRIRNGFAHSIPHHDFEAVGIRTICEDLWIINHNKFVNQTQISTFMGTKALYILAIGLYHWMLTIHQPPLAVSDIIAAHLLPPSP